MRVDINADLGEEITDDSGLLRVVTSANVACGYHAGSPEIMRAVCDEASERGVRVGAQVSYADRANFGRVEHEVDSAVLTQQIADQVGTLGEIARSCGIDVAYIKPHGALYHRVSRDQWQAQAVLDGAPGLPVLGFPDGVILQRALADGRDVRLEGFPDRAYTQDGRLMDRSLPGAVLTDIDEVCDQAIRLAGDVDSLCLHGDTPGAVAFAHAVRRRLEDQGWEIGSCWAPGN